MAANGSAQNSDSVVCHGHSLGQRCQFRSIVDRVWGVDVSFIVSEFALQY